jgi:Na+-translocating ferredoxin:NAD+ oxidoreductase RNF subunit RnfB
MKSPASPDLLLVLRKERCQACTHCIRACPTEAIRIRHGKAQVMAHRCIQCGRCIQACPRGAWEMCSDPLEKLKIERQAMAVLDPTVFWQFGSRTLPQAVIEAFLEVGFSAVKDLGGAFRIYGAAVSRYLSSKSRPFPAIGSFCPAVVQLVQVKYPSLLGNLVPILSPVKIMATRQKDVGLENSAGGLFFIVPCLAQAGAIAETREKAAGFAGVLSLAHVYNPLQMVLSRKRNLAGISSGKELSLSAMRWAKPGGESEALGIPGSLVVDGIDQVADILELVESGRLGDVSFIEARACTNGCLGGPLTIQDSLLARYHMLAWMRGNERRKQKEDRRKVSVDLDGFRLSQPLSARAGMRLDENLKVAMEKLGRIDEVVKKLPGIDCRSCGCPSCLALAEDIVQGYAVETDCLYKLKERRASKPRGKRVSRRPPPKKRDLQS